MPPTADDPAHDLFADIPDDRIAVVSPEGCRVTYGGLRKQVQATAGALAAAGGSGGERVGIALPTACRTS